MAEMKTVGKVAVIILIVLIVLALLAVAGFNIYQRFSYSEFYRHSSKAYIIPGLSDGFIPQGLSYDETDDLYLTCGYMKDGGSSRIYTYDKESNKVSYISLVNESGQADDCHAGGLSVYGDLLFFASGEKINVYDMKDIRNGADKISPISSFDPGFAPAFCHVEGDRLFVGEFYIAEDYETPVSHHMTTDSGDKHHAIMTVFKLDTKAEFGIVSEMPEAIYSITDFAQGLCITKSGRLCISTSWGLTKSHVYVYNDPMSGEADGTFEFTAGTETAEVPLYYLDSAHLEKDWTLPPMSEELLYRDGSVYVMFESASNKYLFGKISGGTYVYSFEEK